MARSSTPRVNKTPGRQARHVARAQASRVRRGGRKALRDRVHVSRRSKAFQALSKVRTARRKTDVRRFQREGRAGVGQPKRPGPRQDRAAGTPAPPRTKRRGPTARPPGRWPGPGDVPAYGPSIGAGKTGQARTNIRRRKGAPPSAGHRPGRRG